MTKIVEYEDIEITESINYINYKTFISYKKSYVDKIQFPDISTLLFEDQTKIYIVCSIIQKLYSKINKRIEKASLYRLNEYACKICKQIRKSTNPEAIHFYYMASRCVPILPSNPSNLFNFS